MVILSENQLVSKLGCYVCNNSNPQFRSSSFDGRVVTYCGNCFVIIKGSKEDFIVKQFCNNCNYKTRVYPPDNSKCSGCCKFYSEGDVV